jgi:transposase
VRRNFYEAREQAPQPDRSKAARRCAHEPELSDLAAPVPRSVLFKKSRRYLPRSAFGQAIDYALSNWPLLGIYLEDGRIEIDNNLMQTLFGLLLSEKRIGCFSAMPMPANAAPSFTPFSRCRCRGIDPHAYLHEVLTKLPSMTNWQVKHVTPEAWAKASRSPATATAA